VAINSSSFATAADDQAWASAKHIDY
jgi:hypothetical protein